MATFYISVTTETLYLVESENEDQAIDLATGAEDDTEGAVQEVDSDTTNITAWEA